ncbi:MAG: cytochrome c peroxidase [Arenicella sp.]|jgi:cytochrome c peroxidase
MRKTSNRWLSVGSLAFLFLFLSACQDDDEALSLDFELEEVLASTSNGLGKSYFQQPSSDDFQSIPQDPKNPLTADKVKLGQLLFHETGIAIDPKFSGSSGTYSCASCHHVRAGFQAGVKQGVGEGGIGFGVNGEGRIHEFNRTDFDVQPLRTPSIMNGAYQKLQLWSGQFGATDANIGTESQWTAETPKETNHLGYEGLETQAIAGLGVHRMKMDIDSLTKTGYVELFDKAFPNVDKSERYDMERAGLAIAAYERTVLSNQAPFQKWLNGEFSALSDDEKRGAMLFFGKAECANCHTGPALNSMKFEALGMSDLGGAGASVSVKDATDAGKGRGSFTTKSEDMYKFKVPQLYNLTQSKFYGHGGNFNSIKDIIDYKNKAVKENSLVPDSQLSAEFKPLNLSEQEVSYLVKFLENGLYDKQLERYVPESLPSGNCFPNADAQSIIDLDCK